MRVSKRLNISHPTIERLHGRFLGESSIAECQAALNTFHNMHYRDNKQRLRDFETVVFNGIAAFANSQRAQDAVQLADWALENETVRLTSITFHAISYERSRSMASWNLYGPAAAIECFIASIEVFRRKARGKNRKPSWTGFILLQDINDFKMGDSLSPHEIACYSRKLFRLYFPKSRVPTAIENAITNAKLTRRQLDKVLRTIEFPSDNDAVRKYK